MKYIFILLTLNALLFGLDKNDFTYTRDINSTATSGIINIELPIAVLEHISPYTHPDIAVFDSNNRRMPHALIDQNPQEEKRKEMSLPYTLITKEQLENRTSLYIAMNDKTISLQETVTLQEQDYIVDATSMQEGIDHLLIHGYDTNYMIKTDVWCSSDLNNWRLIADKAVLANLYMQERHVGNNRINLRGARCNYLKIHAQEPIIISEILGVKALSVAQPRKSHNLSNDRVDGGIEFKVASMVRVDKLHFSLPPKEQFYTFNLLTYNYNDLSWNILKQITIYSLQNGKLNHLDTKLNPSQKYRLEAIDGAYLPEDMNLSFTYIPTQLYFIAQGKAPYSLNYKAAVPVPSSGYLDTILTLDQSSSEATLLNERLNDKQESVKETTSNFSGVAVWLALILGVVVLSFMSLIVFKELKQDQKS